LAARIDFPRVEEPAAVAHRQDDHRVLIQSVDDAVFPMENLPDFVSSHFGDRVTAFGKRGKTINPLEDGQTPFLRRVRSVPRDVVDDFSKTDERPRRPDDLHRLSVASTCFFASS
jgi:hypothetical protein